jgi:hypothetical protein
MISSWVKTEYANELRLQIIRTRRTTIMRVAGTRQRLVSTPSDNGKKLKDKGLGLVKFSFAPTPGIRCRGSWHCCRFLLVKWGGELAFIEGYQRREAQERSILTVGFWISVP